jgi:hypothetical protein
MKLSSMKSLAIAACMLPASFGLVAGQAIAADRNETVRFAAGASSASLSGSLTGYDSVNYRLGPSAGQTMQVLLSPSHASCYFNVLPPGSDRAIFIGSTTGNEFAARLRQDGNYTVQVYQMRNAARRGTTCRYDISFEITGGNQAAMVPGDEMDGDDGEGALDGARFTRRDARQACVHRIHELYGIRRNAISDVSATREGRDNFRLSGKVVRHQSLPDTFTCRVTHGEVVALRLHTPDKPETAIGKAVLGAVLLGTAEALAGDEADHRPHPAHSHGNPFTDQQHLNQACRHEIARNLRHSHAQFDRIRLVTSHLRHRTLEGTGSIRWFNTDHMMHFTCQFDRRGRLVDGQFYYYPAEPAAYTPDYADGNAGGPDGWRVTGVANNDVLYVHSRASLASRRVGSLPHNARGVRNLGCQWSEHDHGTWCEVEWQGLRGFAAQRYLAEDS